MDNEGRKSWFTGDKCPVCGRAVETNGQYDWCCSTQFTPVYPPVRVESEAVEDGDHN